MEYPETRRCSPRQRHHKIFPSLIADPDLSGNHINDAWLAALVNLDQGFSRFPGLS